MKEIVCVTLTQNVRTFIILPTSVFGIKCHILAENLWVSNYTKDT